MYKNLLKKHIFHSYLNESKADRHGFWTGGEIGQQPHYRGQHLPVGRLSLASCIRFRSESIPFLIIMFNAIIAFRSGHLSRQIRFPNENTM
jgi:hypothetical protein